MLGPCIFIHESKKVKKIIITVFTVHTIVMTLTAGLTTYSSAETALYFAVQLFL
jgi:hypothetical protein